MLAPATYSRKIAQKLVLVVAFFATTGLLSAHPHLWIDARVAFQFNGNAVEHIEVEWVFDPFFTEMIMLDFDTNRDRQISPQESREIQEGAFNNLRHFSFFLEIRLDDTRRTVTQDMIRDFRATVENDVLVYRFNVHLNHTLRRGNTRVAVAMYDETYFTDIALKEDPPARLRGAPPDLDLELAMETRMDRVWYFVNIPTREVVLRIRRSS